jgi:type I site-specific restriction endonuclease
VHRDDEDETVINGPPIPPPPDGGRSKIYIDGVTAFIIAERVEYLDENGKLVAESLRDYTKKALRKRFASLDDFLKSWKGAERKQAIVDELAAEGLPLDSVAAELGTNLDPFDLICHLAFDRKPLTRRERADNVKKRDVFGRFEGEARAVLDALLGKYADEEVLTLDDSNILRVPPLNSLGTPWNSSGPSAAEMASMQQYTSCKPRFIRKLLSPCPFATLSRPSRMKCVRTRASMVMPSALASFAGCSFSRSSTIRTKSWK